MSCRLPAGSHHCCPSSHAFSTPDTTHHAAEQIHHRHYANVAREDGSMQRSEWSGRSAAGNRRAHEGGDCRAQRHTQIAGLSSWLHSRTAGRVVIAGRE